jgi:hypothetical protein
VSAREVQEMQGRLNALFHHYRVERSKRDDQFVADITALAAQMTEAGIAPVDLSAENRADMQDYLEEVCLQDPVKDHLYALVNDVDVHLRIVEYALDQAFERERAVANEPGSDLSHLIEEVG